MAPIKYRIEPNPMTTPGSYKLRFIPQGVNGYDEVAEAVALKNPNLPAALQTQFASIANTEVLVVPHIPAQNDPWNNEYILSLSTRYTEHGLL